MTFLFSAWAVWVEWGQQEGSQPGRRRDDIGVDEHREESKSRSGASEDLAVLWSWGLV